MATDPADTAQQAGRPAGQQASFTSSRQGGFKINKPQTEKRAARSVTT